MERMSIRFKNKKESVHDKSQDVSVSDLKDYKHVSLISSNNGGWQHNKSDNENLYMLMDYENSEERKHSQ